MQYVPAGTAMAAMQSITATLDEGVLTIAFNRPQEGNAIGAALSAEMAALLRAVAADDTVRTVVLRGAGENFSCGMDARDFVGEDGRDTAATRALRDEADDWRTRTLRLLPQPVIGMVQGECSGAALAVVESCDIVFTAMDARFSAVGPREGGLASGAAAKSASDLMTPRSARYFFLTGESFDGVEAERNGMATQAFPAQELEEAVYTLARELAAKDATALRFTKETLQHVGAMTWDGVLSFTAAKFAELKAQQAGQPSARAAAVQSFLSGKSKPGLGG
jgi:enoyl-CoA hydratase/carnithine racemase